jgi:hypothetical protein
MSELRDTLRALESHLATLMQQIDAAHAAGDQAALDAIDPTAGWPA